MPSHTVPVVLTRSTSVSKRASSTSIPPSWLSWVLRWKPVAILCSTVAPGQHVARELLDREVAEGEVAVEGVDHPVAVLPGGAALVLLVAVRVGVAGEVQPGPRPALAVVGRGEEAVDDLLVGVRAAVGEEGVDLRRRRGKADEVEAEPADERLARGLGRGREALLLEPREDERVDGVPHPLRARDRGHGGPRRLHVGPVDGRIAPPGRAAGARRSRHPGVDPGREPRDLLGRQRRLLVRHAGRRPAVEVLDEQALARCGPPRARGPTSRPRGARRGCRGAGRSPAPSARGRRRSARGGSARRRARSREAAAAGTPARAPAPSDAKADDRRRRGHEGRAHASSHRQHPRGGSGDSRSVPATTGAGHRAARPRLPVNRTKRHPRSCL